jgi:capsular polysaccharide transport system permease protein
MKDMLTEAGAMPPPPVLLAGPATAQGRGRRRHRIGPGQASFVLCVLLPMAVALWYLHRVAADQYHSSLAFSVRAEEVSSAAVGLLGAITQISSGSASDTDILYDAIRSQPMVEAVDRRLGLRPIFSRPAWDPVFALPPDAPIEDLVRYWGRMVHVTLDGTAGILRIRVEAFRPEDATAIAEAILAESTLIVNRLSDAARNDAVRFATADLATAEDRLRDLRGKLAAFRRSYGIVDPEAGMAGQAGILGALESELAQAYVERDMLLSYAGEGDQRVLQSNRRIDAISARIEAERLSLGIGASAKDATEVMGRYEALLTDLGFAQAAYTQAQTGLSAAQAEARRQARYLAPHVLPTRADTPVYPRRWLLSGLAALFLLLIWGAAAVALASARDARPAAGRPG